jgi:carboxyl-terminal processing protease
MQPSHNQQESNQLLDQSKTNKNHPWLSRVSRSKWAVVTLLGGFVVGVAVSASSMKKDNSLPVNELREFASVYGLIKKAYVEEVEDKKLIRGAIAGMLYDLDPHSAYLDEEGYKELKSNTSGEFGGLGIEIGTEDGFVKVISPIEDTPAQRAGIMAGDLIVRINEASTKSLSLSESVKRMRGKPGTPVTLTISRKNTDQPIVIKIVRAIIKVKSIKGKNLEPGYAWLRITQFQERTVENMLDKLDEILKQDPSLKGLVIDLRNNPGGLLQGAVGVAAAFLPDNVTVVETRGRNIDSAFQLKTDLMGTRFDDNLAQRVAAIRAKLKDVKIVVLVNSGSASASEIVSGALQDYGRATIMGQTTFGKASVQSVLPLNEQGTTALKITTARYYTPKGRSIQAKGIEPEMKVDETAEGNLLSQNFREVDYDKHLKNDQGSEADKVKIDEIAKEREKIKEKLEKDKNFKLPEYGSEKDWQLIQALNYLQGKPVVMSKPEPKKEEKKDEKSEEQE